MLKKLKILIFSFFLIYKTTKVGKDQKKDLTLRNSIPILLKNNLSYNSEVSRLESKKYNLESARGKFFYPNMDINVNYSFGGWKNSETELNKKSKNFPNGLDALAPKTDNMYHSIGTSLEVNKLLYAFGRLKAAWDISLYEYYIQKLNLIKVRNELVRNLKISFYNVFLTQEVYNFFKKKDEFVENLYRYQKDNFNNSMIDEYEYMNLEIERNESKLELIKRKNDVLYAKNIIYLLLGLDLLKGTKNNEKYNIKGSLIEEDNNFYFVDVQEIKKVLFIKSKYFKNTLQESIDIKSRKNDIEKIRNVKLSIKELVQFAYNNRIDLLTLLFKKKVLENRKKIVMSEWLPEFLFFTKIKYKALNDETFSKDFDHKFNYDIGLAIKIPFLKLINPDSSGHKKTKASQYDINTLDSKIKYLKKNIKKEVIETYLKYETFLNRISIEKKVLEFSKKKYLITLDKYKNGIASYIEYKSSSVNYKKAKLRYYENYFSYKKTFLEILLKIGYL